MRYFPALIILCLFYTPVSYAAPSDKAKLLPVLAYAKLPHAKALKVSPNGTMTAYLSSIKGRKHLVIKNANGINNPKAVPPVKKADIIWFKWINDSYLLIAYRYTELNWGHRHAESRMLSYNVNTGKFALMMEPKMNSAAASGRVGNIQDGIVSFLPDDPDHFLMAYDRNGKGRYMIEKVNVATGYGKLYESPRPYVQSWKVDKQHQARLAYGYGNHHFVAEYNNPKTGEWQDATQSNWYKNDIEILHFFADPRFAYARHQQANGLNAIVKYDLIDDRATETLFSHDKLDISGLVYAPGTETVIGYRINGDHPTIQYSDPYYRKISKALIQVLGGGWLKFIYHNKELDVVVIRHESLTQPGTFYRFNKTKLTLDHIINERVDSVNDNMALTTAHDYQARDGLTIRAFLTLPKGSGGKGLPTIILPHGGPSSRDDLSYDYEVQFLANRGYAVFRPNFRGSTGYGESFQKAGSHQWGGAMQDDVTDGTHWLIDQGIADPARICIMGGSYGGYAALMGVVREPDLYKCAISINGVSNIPDMKANDKRFIGGRAWTKRMGLLGVNDKEISPYHRAREIKVPILLIHAKDDPRVPYAQSSSMYRRLKKYKIPVTKVKVKNGDHFLDTEESRLKSLRAIEAFLSNNLGR